MDGRDLARFAAIALALAAGACGSSPATSDAGADATTDVAVADTGVVRRVLAFGSRRGTACAQDHSCACLLAQYGARCVCGLDPTGNGLVLRCVAP